jgi:hypothetical protein
MMGAVRVQHFASSDPMANRWSSATAGSPTSLEDVAKFAGRISIATLRPSSSAEAELPESVTACWISSGRCFGSGTVFWTASCREPASATESSASDEGCSKLSRGCGACHPWRTFVRGLHKVETHLFTFTEVEGVPPTNNDAERDLRAAVIWRRLSQCTKSERGRRLGRYAPRHGRERLELSLESHSLVFVERALTIVTSLRAQGRNVFAFLRDLLSPGSPTPSLLPSTS